MEDSLPCLLIGAPSSRCDSVERFKNGNLELLTNLPLLRESKLVAEPMEDSLPCLLIAAPSSKCGSVDRFKNGNLELLTILPLLRVLQTDPPMEDSLPCRLIVASLGPNVGASFSVFCFEREKRLSFDFWDLVDAVELVVDIRFIPPARFSLLNTLRIVLLSPRRLRGIRALINRSGGCVTV